MELIDKNIDAIKRLCKKHYVQNLYLFGSFATGNYTANSDIDFLVQFEDVPPLEYFDNYCDFKESLKKIFSREVDLLEAQTIKNPILKKSIDRDKILIYGRADSKVAV